MIPSQRHLFDLPDDVAYLNCAYMAPLMHSVVEAGIRGARRKARPWEITAPDFFSDGARARGLFARIRPGLSNFQIIQHNQGIAGLSAYSGAFWAYSPVTLNSLTTRYSPFRLTRFGRSVLPST